MQIFCDGLTPEEFKRTMLLLGQYYVVLMSTETGYAAWRNM